MNLNQAQEKYDELNKKINEIRKEYGWRSKAFHGSYYEPDSARERRMEYYEENFKKLDKKIYRECKDLISELKPLMDETNEIYDKYRYMDYDEHGNITEHSAYPIITNYGEYGRLNPYEEFNLFCDQFKSQNAGKGNQINESGFYSYSPDNFSFERGNCYLNYVLSHIMKESKYIIQGHASYKTKDGKSVWKFPEEDMNALPIEEVSIILNKLSDLKLNYDYECEKIRDNYEMKIMKQMNILRDYEYEKDNLERYCKNNNISIEIKK